MKPLPAPFWDRFLERHWAHAPLRIDRRIAGPFARPGELLDGLIHASDRFRAGDRSVPIKLLTRDETDLGPDALVPLLPRRADRGVEGYAARVARALGDDQFTLLLNCYERFDPVVTRRAQRFIGPALRAIPAGASNISVFLGSYDRTPVGIHRDPASIFMFVVHGRKRMLVWPGDAFLPAAAAGHPADYEALRSLRLGPAQRRRLEQPIALDGAEGDVLFWPSTYWHVGECPRGVALTLSIGLNPVHAPTPRAAAAVRA
jgi:50S ribosomal protein L16 3-hydroxylase